MCDILEIFPYQEPTCGIYTNDNDLSEFTFIDSRELTWAGVLSSENCNAYNGAYWVIKNNGTG